MNNKNMKAHASQLFGAAAGIKPHPEPAPEQEPGEIKVTKTMEAFVDFAEPATPRRKQPYYRLNLKLSPELDGYLQVECHRRGMSRTEFINQLLLAYAKENPHR
jgi:hypothetical protein